MEDDILHGLYTKKWTIVNRVKPRYMKHGHSGTHPSSILLLGEAYKKVLQKSFDDHHNSFILRK